MKSLSKAWILVLLVLVSKADWAQTGDASIDLESGNEHLPGLTSPDAFTRVGQQSFLSGHPALNPEDDTINVVIEIPAGSVAKWEVDKADGVLRWEFSDGTPRVVRYLGYPGNYGMVPRTLLSRESGGDGDPLDVLVLGPPLPRGAVVRARALGIIALLDDGEKDDKVIAVHQASEFGYLMNMKELESQFPGVTEIIRIWFENYKGPGRIVAGEFLGAESAEEAVHAAAEAFEREARD